jgi:nicotinamide-nucleotide amidase
VQIEIVTIGNEILSGRTVDTNFAWLARALEEASVQVAWHSTAGDSGERIAEALIRALERADAVVMTGGLGPTPDDMTRKAVANVLGRSLRLDEDVLAAIRERARKLGRLLPSSVESQALIPVGAQTWHNRLGTAPGLLLMHDGTPVILLPGVPYEMEALAKEFAIPYLRARTGRRVESFTLRTAGVSESMLQEKIALLPQSWPGAQLAYLPSYFGVDLRVTVTGDDPERVELVTAKAYDQLRAVAGPVMYAEGATPIEQVVGETLMELGARVATAESCTGGLVAKRLTDTPGSSRYFERGFVTYSNVSKVQLLGVKAADLEAHGAVSAPIAEQMAAGAAKRAGVEAAVGVTGVAGPEGGSDEKPLGTVFIAVYGARGTAVREYHFVGTRNTVRERAAQIALDLLRRHLRGLPLEATLE